MKRKSIKAEEFDKEFDQGKGITDYLYLDQAEKPGQKQKRVSVDFPSWMI